MKSANIAPVGSVSIENDPTCGIGTFSIIGVAPNDFALAVAAVRSGVKK